MDENEVKLLAYLIAEGHTKKIVLFSNMDRKIINDFEKSLNKFDDSLKLIEEKVGCFRISNPNWRNKIIFHDNSRDKGGRFLKGIKN